MRIYFEKNSKSLRLLSETFVVVLAKYFTALPTTLLVIQHFSIEIDFVFTHLRHTGNKFMHRKPTSFLIKIMAKT